MVLWLSAFALFVAIPFPPASAAAEKEISIDVKPKEVPPVDSNVEIACTGPLQNGGALAKKVGSGEEAKYQQLVRFKVEEMNSEKKVGEKTRKAVLMVPEGGGKIDRFTGLLNMDRHSIKLTFRVLFSDTGYFVCQFFGNDGSTVVMKTDAVGLSSFYPARVLRLSHRELLTKDKKFVDVIECSAFTGVPQGSVELFMDGKAIPADRLVRSLTLEGGAMGYRMTLSTRVPVSMQLFNRTVSCVAGRRDEKKNLPGNKKVAARSIRLDNLKVPVDEVRIVDSQKVFKNVGDELICNATGVPEPEIIWKLQGSKISKATVKVPGRPGIYTASCTATNKIGRQQYTKMKEINFAVVEPCEKAAAPNRYVLIASFIFAVCFFVLMIVFASLWFQSRKQSQYDQMR